MNSGRRNQHGFRGGEPDLIPHLGLRSSTSNEHEQQIV
jgi:hypothetical protein